MLKEKIVGKTGTASSPVQKIKLVDGNFSPSEAQDVINSLIDVKINFHKLQRLTVCIHKEDSDTQYLNSRMIELLEAGKEASSFIAKAREAGKDLKITGHLNISFE